jgi:hypothetical protein
VDLEWAIKVGDAASHSRFNSLDALIIWRGSHVFEV